MRAFSVLSTTLFAATAWALTITSPGEGSSWNAATRSQNVAWTSVSTDPSNFSIALVNMQTTPPINVILKANVPTDDGSTTVDGPAVGWPTGNGFQINFVQPNPTGAAILVQSQQFSINGTTTPFTSLISSTSSTGTSSSPSGTSGSSGTNGAMGLTVQTGFVAGLVLVGGLLA